MGIVESRMAVQRLENALSELRATVEKLCNEGTEAHAKAILLRAEADLVVHRAQAKQHADLLESCEAGLAAGPGKPPPHLRPLG